MTDPPRDAMHTSTNPEDDVQMTFLEHLADLRVRLIWSMAALLPTTLLGLAGADQILAVLTKQARDAIAQQQQAHAPAQQWGLAVSPWGLTPTLIIPTPQPLKKHVLSPTEGIMAYFKIAIVTGIFLSFPVIMFQLWLFISPGLYRRERRIILPFLVAGWLMFIAGGCFGYFVMLKYALYFLAGIGSAHYEMTWSLARYLNFALLSLLVCGVIFELPVVCTLLSRMGLISPRFLTDNRRYAICIMAVLSAVLTPQDPFTMMLMLAPLLLLYEISVIASRMVYTGPPPPEPPPAD